MNEEIKEFVEFRTDEDGTYFYYNDKDNVEQWSYKLDVLKDYIINLQQENARLKDKIEKVIEYVNHYESIKGYYEYEECGYDEYNYEEDLKEELLELLKEN